MFEGKKNAKAIKMVNIIRMIEKCGNYDYWTYARQPSWWVSNIMNYYIAEGKYQEELNNQRK